MAVQIGVILLTLLGAYFFKHIRVNDNIQRKYFIVFVCVICIFQSGLRNVAVGADTYAYRLLFEEMDQWSWAQNFQNFYDVYFLGEGKDAGYKLLMKIFHLFSGDYQVYLFCIAIFFFYALGRFLYRNTFCIQDVVFAIILYQALFYEFFSITGIRQTIATGIALIGFESIKQKRLLRFSILILLGALIHKSVLLFFPFYFIANFDKSKKIYLFSVLLFPFLISLGSAFALQLALLSGSDNYLMYAEEKTSGAWGFLTLFIFIVFWGIMYYRESMKIDGAYRLHNAMAMVILLLPLTFVSAALMRVVQYYSVFLLLFLPMIINILDRKQRFLKIIVQTLICFLLIYKIIKTDIPFAWYWELMKLGSNY